MLMYNQFSPAIFLLKSLFIFCCCYDEDYEGGTLGGGGKQWRWKNSVRLLMAGFFFSNTRYKRAQTCCNNDCRGVDYSQAWHYTQAAKIGREDAIKKKIRQRAACCWYVEKSFPSNSLWWDKMNSKVAVMISIPAYSAPTNGTLFVNYVGNRIKNKQQLNSIFLNLTNCEARIKVPMDRLCIL